ncbi:MAG: sensor histidine kinase [Saprospiraceae bacterium]|nr:sensor histidine kinase [Saprospiraceae bacterium]
MANLLSNAIKFSNDGGSIFVTIRPMTGQTIQIEVMDTGIGISEEQIPSLFERFSKTTHSELQPGSGLGLALVKELSELHGGGVTVKSKEGEGSVFTVTMRVDRSFLTTISLPIKLLRTKHQLLKPLFQIPLLYPKVRKN